MKWIGLFVISLISSSCNFRINKTDNNSVLKQLAENPNSLSYAVIKYYILDAKCIACHSGATNNFTSYSLVKSRIQDIEKKAVIDQVMPPNNPLSAAEIKVLKTWIDIGAPEIAENPINIPPVVPLEPTFTSIQQDILQIKCVACHSPNGKAHDVPLTSYSEIMNSPRDLVVPNSPSDSEIVIAITRTDKKRMPPPDVAASLSSGEIAVIEQWIQMGAKESSVLPNRFKSKRP